MNDLQAADPITGHAGQRDPRPRRWFRRFLERAWAPFVAQLLPLLARLRGCVPTHSPALVLKEKASRGGSAGLAGGCPPLWRLRGPRMAPRLRATPRG
jgi:hypothetical protein